MSRGGEGSHEIWPPILEKAYAKMHGNFEDIEAGVISVALGELCGGVSKNYNFEKEDVVSKIRDGSLFNELASSLAEGNVAGASSHQGSDEETDAMGIVQGHA